MNVRETSKAGPVEESATTNGRNGSILTPDPDLRSKTHSGPAYGLDADSTSSSLSVDELSQVVLRQAHEVCDLKRRFFDEQARTISECCMAMAKAFDQGGKLLVMGNGGSSCDAAHMAVECMHPIITKRPPLPAIALNLDTALLTAVGNDQDFSMAYIKQLAMYGQPGDMVMGMSTSGKSANVIRALRTARERGMMTIGYAGKDGGRMPDWCDYCFVVPSFSIPRIQETHETLLHLMWDLIHVYRGEEDVF